MLLTACAAGAAEDIETPTPNVVEELATPVTATVAPSVDGKGSAAWLEALLDDETMPLELAITGGSVAAHIADGLLVLDDLYVEVADLELPASAIPRNGARLTGLAFELKTPVAAEPAFMDDDVVIAEMSAIALVHWTMVKDGVEIELADLELRDIELMVGVNVEDDVPVVRISGGQEGELWSWLDHFGLADLHMSLVASTVVIVE